MGMDLTSQQAENLHRNLSGFNLKLDKVIRDGNFFFKSVARQIPTYLKGENRRTEEHFRSLGIGEHGEGNTAKLRKQNMLLSKPFTTSLLSGLFHINSLNFIDAMPSNNSIKFWPW